MNLYKGGLYIKDKSILRAIIEGLPIIPHISLIKQEKKIKLVRHLQCPCTTHSVSKMTNVHPDFLSLG